MLSAVYSYSYSYLTEDLPRNRRARELLDRYLISAENIEMNSLTTRVHPLDHPKLYLVLNFIAWKLVLLCIALTSPGPGYDTSTELLRPFPDLAQANSGTRSEPALRLRSLVRWDAVYYTQVARRGYLWEQEWAFGWGFTNFIAVISKGKRIPPQIHRIN